MKDEEIRTLLKKYKAGTLSQEEKAMLESWYISEAQHSKRKIDELNLSHNLKVIGQGLPLKHTSSFKQNWSKIATAAAIILIASIGIFLFKADRHVGKDSAAGKLLANDFAPGGNSATLTLASGKIINLSDAKSGIIIAANQLSYNDGSILQEQLRDQSSIETLTASTPRGGTYQVILPDGTHVWLNAASSLRFPSKFNGAIRTVELTGEAYFEVAKVTIKNKGVRHKEIRVPFFVKSNKQEIEVLGTHFNVNSYPDEPAVKTTLLEGSVRIITSGASHRAILKPGEQAVVKNDIKIANINAAATVAWKNGEFMFRNEPLENIMRAISRWYDVEVIYQTDVSKKAVWGTITKYSNVSEVLEMITLTGAANFKIEGKKIIVMQ